MLACMRQRYLCHIPFRSNQATMFAKYYNIENGIFTTSPHHERLGRAKSEFSIVPEINGTLYYFPENTVFKMTQELATTGWYDFIH